MNSEVFSKKFIYHIYISGNPEHIEEDKLEEIKK